MYDTPLASLGVGGPQARKIGLLVVLVGLIVLTWSTFVIVPAGSRGVVLWWGRVETRIMSEGLNFKVPLAQREVEAQQKVATAKGEAESILVVATEQAKANEVLTRSLTPILVSYKSVERWNGMLPQVSGGALPFIELGKLSRAAEGTEADKR